MIKWIRAVREDYLTTRANAGEDFLEWLVKRQLPWGLRWWFVAIIAIGYHIFLFDALNLLRFFYFALFVAVCVGIARLIRWGRDAVHLYQRHKAQKLMTKEEPLTEDSPIIK